LALCAAEIGVEIGLIYFYEQPEKMTREISLMLQGAAIGMQAAGTFNPVPEFDVSEIHGEPVK
jgi:hypothetical protein